MASTTSKKILFLTNSDYGQANVMLATAHELMIREKNIEIHICSLEGLRRAVAEASQYALENSVGEPAPPLVFHGMRGRSQFEASIGSGTNLFEAWDRPPTFVNAARSILCIDGIIQPWNPDEFADIYHQCYDVLHKVKPDLTVVDPLFTPGLTVCNHVGVHWIVLSPNTIKDFAVPLQPRLAGLWKYPVVCSALPYPLPASMIPMNLGLTLVAAYTLVTSQKVKNAEEALLERMGENITIMTANELGVLKAPPPGLRILTANAPELDYPFDVMPPQVVPCGPIIRASDEISKLDKSLANWLARGPTLYINLGSHLEATVSEAVEMAAAYREFLDQAKESKQYMSQELKVLWKLKVKGVQSEKSSTSSCVAQIGQEAYDGIHAILGKEMNRDQIRITNWVTVEPKSVLESGHIICSVNHGGANSFNEALCASIPQIILPGWADCYDFGSRVELLGIGRWGNKEAKPRWKKDELSRCLSEILLGPESDAIRLRANELGEKYPEDSGRRMAAQTLVNALTNKAQ